MTSVGLGRIITTTPVRTVIDLAPNLDIEALRDVVDEVLVKKMCDLSRMRRRLERLGNGRAGAASLRKLIDEYQGGDLLPRSVLERRYMDAAAATQLPVAALQFPVTAGAKRYLIDFAYPEHMLAVELDGWRFHGGRAAWEADIERSNALVAAGWRVLRGTWRSIQDDPSTLLRRVGLLLNPSLTGWGEVCPSSTPGRDLRAKPL